MLYVCSPGIILIQLFSDQVRADVTLWLCLSGVSYQVFCSTQSASMRPFKRYIVVLTLFAMFVQINCVLACYGLFFLNRKAIAATVCEKKTRNCCGHCFLQKKVAAASDDEPRPEDSRQNTATKSLAEQLDMVLGVKPENRHFWNAPVAGRKFTDCPDCNLLGGSSPGIDHPPKA